jgi:hypothetical protein
MARRYRSCRRSTLCSTGLRNCRTKWGTDVAPALASHSTGLGLSQNDRFPDMTVLHPSPVRATLPNPRVNPSVVQSSCDRRWHRCLAQSIWLPRPATCSLVGED